MRWPWGAPSEPVDDVKLESRKSRAELLAVMKELDSYRARLRRALSELHAATAARQGGKAGGSGAYGG